MRRFLALLFIVSVFMCCSSRKLAKSSAGGGELIFQSGFENDSKVVGKDDRSDIAGIDKSLPVRNDWVADLDNHPNIGNFSIQYEGGDSTMRSAKIIAEPGDPANHVLQFWLKEPNVHGTKGAYKQISMATTDSKNFTSRSASSCTLILMRCGGIRKRYTGLPSQNSGTTSPGARPCRIAFASPWASAN